MKRSEARTQFLADVLTTGVETGYEWFDWTEYQHEYMAGVEIEDVRAACRFFRDDDSYSEDSVEITLDDIASAIEKIEQTGPSIGLHKDNIGIILGGRSDNDAGDIDADLADAIIQVAVFGEVIYG